MQDLNPDNNEWSPPLPLEGVPLKPWPQEVFPAPFELFAAELARSTETPRELSALLTLATVAVAAQKKYRVQVKLDYSEPVNIWVQVILPPASRKSRVYSEAMLPLKKWEEGQRVILEPQIKALDSQRKTMEARINELRKAAAKSKNEDEYTQLQKHVEQLEQELPEVPGYPRLWTSDVTPEHLGTIMAENDEALAVMSDEGGIFDILNGLYSDGKANIDLFLQSHAGSSVRVDRGSRPPVFMQSPVLTMALTVQPEQTRNLCNNKTFRGRGLLGRFLYAIPKSNIGARTFDEPAMYQEHIKQYQEAIWSILHHPYSLDGQGNAPHCLRLTDEAREKWLEYAKLIELMMSEEGGILSHITDWAGKLPGAIARIGGLLHIMRYAHQKPWEWNIEAEDMTLAVKIGHVLINHALHVFDLLHMSNGMQVARAVLAWIREKRLMLFSRRECARKFRRFKKDELSQGIELLKEHEILREREVKAESGRGRPSDMCDVNPLLFEE